MPMTLVLFLKDLKYHHRGHRGAERYTEKRQKIKIFILCVLFFTSADEKTKGVTLNNKNIHKYGNGHRLGGHRIVSHRILRITGVMVNSEITSNDSLGV